MSTQKVETNKTIEVLWTGGFDSSFRIAELSRQPVCIQPYYISDNREVESYELSAIKKIRELLLERAETKCELLPLIYLKKSDIHIEKYITESYKRLRDDMTIGSQYEWLASFALEHPGIELGAVSGGTIGRLVRKYGNFIEVNDNIGDNYAVNRDITNEDVCLIFGNYNFPLLYKSKEQIRQIYYSWNYDDIMNATWFCHHPISGGPCGICNPCKVTIEEGLKERFSKDALFRYKFRVPARYIRGGIRRIKRLLEKRPI